MQCFLYTRAPGLANDHFYAHPLDMVVNLDMNTQKVLHSQAMAARSCRPAPRVSATALGQATGRTLPHRSPHTCDHVFWISGRLLEHYPDQTTISDCPGGGACISS